MFEGRDFSSKLQLQNITKSTNIELQKIITYKKTCQAILFEKVLVAHAFISLGFYGNYACVLESRKMASPPKFQMSGITWPPHRIFEKKKFLFQSTHLWLVWTKKSGWLTNFNIDITNCLICVLGRRGILTIYNYMVCGWVKKRWGKAYTLALILTGDRINS